MDLLQGIKIIDFTRLLPGPVATHLLAQMGAEVVKIESPKRMDYMRKGLDMGSDTSILFHQLNHNKTQQIIDYNTEAGKAEILALLKDADALIEQFRPGAMDAWGLGYEEVKKVNPSIVYVALTGYGQNSPLSKEAGHDFNYLAYAGMMDMLKDEQGKPTVPDVQLADIGGAYMAVMALQAALLKKARTGEGSFVDVALTDAVMPFLTIPYSIHRAGFDYQKFNVINGKTTANYSPYECKDGKWISLAALEIKFWNNFCDLVTKPNWKKQHQIELMNFAFPKQEVADLFKTKTREEWTSLFKGHDVCYAPILELAELENFPYHIANNNFETFETPDGKQLKTIGVPFKVR